MIRCIATPHLGLRRDLYPPLCTWAMVSHNCTDCRMFHWVERTYSEQSFLFQGIFNLHTTLIQMMEWTYLHSFALQRVLGLINCLKSVISDRIDLNAYYRPKVTILLPLPCWAIPLNIWQKLWARADKQVHANPVRSSDRASACHLRQYLISPRGPWPLCCMGHNQCYKSGARILCKKHHPPTLW